jgi:hypothetical protein
MGEVWRARDTRLQRDVAVKVLPSELSSDAGRLRRFEKEARSASALNHPNIVTIYDIGSVDSVSYIAMELVDGKTLRELLFTGPLPIKKLLPIASQVADGLAKAHEAGIVHRDLKPENLMMTKDGRVKILDFGLAKLTYTGTGSGEGTNLPTESGTDAGVVMGTVGYMSPEQASGQPIDFRSDQFSFGSILYELLTGKRAFAKPMGAQTLAAIIEQEPEPITALSPQTPAPVRWIVERCLAKDPDERYGTTRDLARELASVRDHLSEISGATGTTEGSARRRTILPAAAIALAMLAAAGAIYMAVRGSRDARAADLRFQQITFRRGWIHGARFAPDGQTIVYGGQWEGRPPELFTSRIGSVESRSLGISPADVLSISSLGEMAVLYPLRDESLGSLATASLSGGAPRTILENVTGASWAPDGKSLAVAHQVGDKGRLEFPIGKVLVETENPIQRVMISRRGDRIAFLENRTLVVVDRKGVRTELQTVGYGYPAFAWSPGGDEIWYSTRPRDVAEFRAVDLSGKERLLATFAGIFVLHDVSADGRMIVERGEERFSTFGLFGRSTEPRTLS